jgi:hypothetical protein
MATVIKKQARPTKQTHSTKTIKSLPRTARESLVRPHMAQPTKKMLAPVLPQYKRRGR